MPRSPTLNLIPPTRIYPSIARRVSSASITNPSRYTILSNFGRVTGHVYVTRLITYLQLIYMRYPGWPNFHVRRAVMSTSIFDKNTFYEINSYIYLHQQIFVTPNIRIRPKRNRVEAAEILFVTRTTLADLLSSLPTTEKRMCTCLFVLVGKMARKRSIAVGFLMPEAAALAISRPGAASTVALSTKSDPSPPPRAAQARSACDDESTDVVVVNGEPVYRLYRYFAPPNALLPEGSLQRHEHVEPHPFVVLDTVLVHDLRFCHKARNQKYQH
ncbi:hypothetical protein ALC56_12339 [Trachymyrmex septentrionalis]|uniref:Uncharacterized protein n=1 Tax=Trachymyrmex septentrionalis TaxID=34720 RepID=A0A195F0E2_9HYME|nr:hypothetical protein ALC56_12339 [Trachymyrmex septentrionalis]